MGRKRRWSLIIPVKPSRDFFEKILTSLTDQAERANSELDLSVPLGEYDEKTWLVTARRVCDRLKGSDSLILVPPSDRLKAPEDIEKKLGGWFHYRPAISLDLKYTVKDVPLPHVIGNDGLGGEWAGRSAQWYATKRNIATPHFGIIVGPWGRDRQDLFRTLLQRERTSKGVTFKELGDGKWTVSDAERLVHEYANSQSPQVLDAIFCTNDLMALGARKAILEASKTAVACLKGTRVIGYDGTDTVRYLLDTGDPVLLNTVNVDTNAMATAATSLITEVTARLPIFMDKQDKFRLIPPTDYEDSLLYHTKNQQDAIT